MLQTTGGPTLLTKENVVLHPHPNSGMDFKHKISQML